MKVLLVIGLVIGGCSQCNEAPETVEPREAQEETREEGRDDVPDEVAPPPARPKPAPPTPEQLEAAREAHGRLREGRRLARQSLWDQAASKFRESIELSDSAPARCELGWALFQTAQMDEAKQELERGARLLSHRRHRERERNTLGACLYNLGRVVEATDPQAAARYYRESLEVRPNETVAARLEELGVAEASVSAPHVERSCEPVRCEGPFANKDAAIASLDIRADDEMAEDDTTGSFAYPVEGVAFIHYEPSWYVCELVTDGTGYGMSYATVTAAQWIAGGEPEITVDIDGFDSGHEEGINNTMGSVTRYFIGRDGDDVVLFGSIVVNSYYDDGMLTDCDCEEDEWESPGCCEIEDISTSTWVRVAYAESGRLRLTRGSTRAGTDGPTTVELVRLQELGCPTGSDE